MLEVIIESNDSAKFAIPGECDCARCTKIAPEVQKILLSGNNPEFFVKTPVYTFDYPFLYVVTTFLKYLGIGAIAFAASQIYPTNFNPFIFWPMTIIAITALVLRVNLDYTREIVEHYQDCAVEYLDLPKDLKAVWKNARKEYKKNIALNPDSQVYENYMEEIRRDIIALMEYYPKAVKKNIMDVYHSRLEAISKKVGKMSELDEGSSKMRMIEASARQSGFIAENKFDLENQYDLR